jgi:N-acetylmuramoyl-L-alanine amidase/PKD repeat protein
MKSLVLLKYMFLLIFLGMALSTSHAQALEGIRICIDPGHGGYGSNDRQIFLPNGIVYWESEGDFQTALHLKEILEGLGASVKLTRTENTDASDISLSERSAIANAFGSDYFHSIHTNGGGGTYSLVLYKESNGNPAFPEAREMGDIMAPVLVDLMKTTHYYNRGDVSFLGFNLGVLKFANMPATLSEASFHDLPEEGLRLKNSEYLKNYAWAIAKSFLAYFEVEGFATGRVGGVVRDITYETVINEVEIQCIPGDKNYTGDDQYNGFYAIGELDPGDYQLVVGKDGYLNDTTDISIEANEYLDLDLSLQYFNNGFPNVDFFTNGLPAGAGQSVSFDAGNSTDDGIIVAYTWDFGDGSPQASGELVFHSFNADGEYPVTLTALDDDGKESSITKNIWIESFPPEAPKLLSLLPGADGSIKARWLESEESNVKSYRLYLSGTRDFSDTLYVLETTLTENAISPDSLEKEVAYYVRLSAVNIVGMESVTGDTYVYYQSDAEQTQDVLIIDGFNRQGSYTQAKHDFVATYLEGLMGIEGLNVYSCSNTAVVSDQLPLTNYDVLIWFLGDESTANVTFSESEQSRVVAFLEAGGKLFVTGSEIGWDLVEKGSESDKDFYRDYFKANYLADGGGGRSPASGLFGSGFDDLILHFGEVYPEDYPDEIGPMDGSEAMMKYVTGAGAGIKYRGNFGNGQKEGGLVYIGFPLESVADTSEVRLFLEKLMAFFNAIPSQVFESGPQVGKIELFPNIVTDQLDLYFDLDRNVEAQISICDQHGRHFYRKKEILSTGKSKISILTEELPPAFYFVCVEILGEKFTYKVVKR